MPYTEQILLRGIAGSTPVHRQDGSQTVRRRRDRHVRGSIPLSHSELRSHLGISSVGRAAKLEISISLRFERRVWQHPAKVCGSNPPYRPATSVSSKPINRQSFGFASFGRNHFCYLFFTGWCATASVLPEVADIAGRLPLPSHGHCSLTPDGAALC